MGIKMPKTLKNFNARVNGNSYAGVATAVQLPTVEVNTDDHRAGGMDFPRKIDMGLNALEATFTVAEMDPVLAGQVGVIDGSSRMWTFKGALNDDESPAAVQVVATMVGSVTKYEPSEGKAGEKTEDKYTMSLKYYELSIDGETIYKIDNDNLIRIVRGVDQMESIRAAIGL